MNHKKISIIVPNWNGLKYLETCLSSLRAQTWAKYSVIVVDNGSTDASLAYISAAFPEVEVIALGTNHGFAKAANTGIKRALESGSDAVALLNNDTRADKSWLSEMAKAMWSGNKIGICAAKMLRMDNEDIIDSAGHVFWGGHIVDRGGGEPDMGQYDFKTDIVGACAGACLYKREMLEALGLFDESFGSYGEDAEFSWRAYKTGWKAIFAPRAVVYHKRYGSSTGDAALTAKISKQGKTNMLRTIKMHATMISKLRISMHWFKEGIKESFSQKGTQYFKMIAQLWRDLP